MRRRATFLMAMLAVALSLAGLRLAAQSAPASTGREAALDRLHSLTTLTIQDWRYHAGDFFAGASPDTDDSSWKELHAGDTFPGDAAWFRCRVEVPPLLHGYDVTGASLRFHFRTDTEADLRLFVNGVEINGLEDGSMPLIAARVAPGEQFLVAILKSSEPSSRRLEGSDLEFTPTAGRPDPEFLRLQFTAAGEVADAIPVGREDREQQIDGALAHLDWSALERGDQKGFDASMRAASDAATPLRAWLKTYSVHAVGNAHIDMAWLWPWTETVDVVHRTFSSALRLMREFPDFTFTMSTARAYAWMEEKYPPLFEEIRQRVREGRWEIVGGMWVEPDLNMPDGESQVRQLLVGKRYFQEKFGVDVRTGWNPDSFGYNWQLPQIYKKSGIDFFVTQKLGWNDTTKFPYKMFWWEAPDGSRVLTYFPHDYVNYMDPARIAGDVAIYAPLTGYPDLLYLYGVGDHGGGPTRDMLLNAERFAAPNALFPRMHLGTAQSYFDALTLKAAGLNLPVWRDELYLQFHRGTYTTQAGEKRNNRHSEVLLLNAEKFAALDGMYTQDYPQADLEDAWKKVLFNQFHDLMAGSGIADIYSDAARSYEDVRAAGGRIVRQSLGDLVLRVDTRGEGSALVVFNALSWPRTEVVETSAPIAQANAPAFEVHDSSGRVVLSELISRSPDINHVTLRFLAENVPPLGYKVFHAVPVEHAAAVPSPISASETTLENEFLRVRVDPATGCITSIYEKTPEREALEPGACGNLLQAFRDKPKEWDAWNIDADFEAQHWDLTAADEVKLAERGPLRAVLRVRKHFQNSTFVQEIILEAGTPLVDVAMQAEWHEKHILLKAAFPVAASSERATYEIPFGSIERPTTRRTPEEQAKFEVPALRWADLSDTHAGVSILNDSKYGYDTKGNVIRLSLLRSPEWPDPHADEGHHEFTYAIYPHAGGWSEAGTMQRGYELNNRLIAVATFHHPGALPAEHSFLTIQPANVIVAALKKAEDSSALILRFYEFTGKETQVRITPPEGVTQALTVNLMEKNASPLEMKDGTVIVPTHPYEIQTVELRFGPDISDGGEK
jgi:alpha-mannosidase